MEPKSVNTAVSSVLSIASGTSVPDVGGSAEVDFAKVISAKQGSAGKQSDQQQGKRPSPDASGQKSALGNDNALIMPTDPLALKLFEPKSDAKTLEVVAAVDTSAALLPSVSIQGGATLSNSAVEMDDLLIRPDAVLAQSVGAEAILVASVEGTAATAVDMVADGKSAPSAPDVTALPVIGEEGYIETAPDLANNLYAGGDQSRAGQNKASRTAELFATNSDDEPGSEDVALQSPITPLAEASEATVTAVDKLAVNSAAVSHTAGKGLTNGKVRPVSDEAVVVAQDLDPNASGAGTKSAAAPATVGPASVDISTYDEIAAIADKVGVLAEQIKDQTAASDALAKSVLTGSGNVSEISAKTVQTNSEATKSQAVGYGSRLEVEARATVVTSSDWIETSGAETKVGKAIEQSLVDARTTDAKPVEAKTVEGTEKGATLANSKPADGVFAEARPADIKVMDAKPSEPKILEHAAAKSSTIEVTAGKETTARPQNSDRIAASDTPQKAVIKGNEPSSGKSDTNLTLEKSLVGAKQDMTTAQQKLAVAAETAEINAAVRPTAKTTVQNSVAQATVIKQGTETAAQIAPVQTEMTKQMRRTMESAASDKKATIEGLDGKLKDATVEQIAQKLAPNIDQLARNKELETASSVVAEDDTAASEMMAPVNAGSGKPQANLAVPSNTTTPAQNLAGLERWSNSIVDVQKQGWTQSLVRRVAAMPTNGGRLVITLQPASLGKISVSIAEGRRGMDIRMRTETSATAALLNDAESRISQLLQSSGMQLNSFSADTNGSFAENENSSDDSGSRDQSGGQKSAQAGQELPENAEQSIAQQGDGLVNLIA